MSEKLSSLHLDKATPLPEYDAPPELVKITDLKDELAPEGASHYVKTKVHTVRRANGSIGHQVVNDMAKGVSIVPIDVVNGHGYAIMVDQVRYPHVDPRHGDLSLDEAAQQGKIGRWGREIISGGVNPDETNEQAAIREAEEEAGIYGLRAEQLIRIYPELKSSVGINNQPFDLRVAELEDGMWQPDRKRPDIEEGDMKMGAYRLDTAVNEMINNGTIWEMSAVTALAGLWRLPRFRKYL